MAANVNFVVDHLGTIFMLVGALGTIAFGIVENAKRLDWIGEAGFFVIKKMLQPLFAVLEEAYGPNVEGLLRAQYRGEQKDLARIIRQGVRVGLNEDNADTVARALGVVDPEDLKKAARAARAGQMVPDDLRNVLGRFELAVDARTEAALIIAQDYYARTAKIVASFVAVGLAVSVAIFVFGLDALVPALLIGLAAVPVAPVAKDLAAAIQTAVGLLRAKT